MRVSVCLPVHTCMFHLFEDSADGDGSRFEGRNVIGLIIKGAVTFGVPPGKLCLPVNTAGFTWYSQGQRS